MPCLENSVYASKVLHDSARFAQEGIGLLGNLEFEYCSALLFLSGGWIM